MIFVTGDAALETQRLSPARFTKLNRAMLEMLRQTEQGYSAAITIVAVSASAQGIHQIRWMMRPSKLTAISKPSVEG
jgi:hypothetical protein